MNKYARIDKQVHKANVYFILWMTHDMTMKDIAEKFDVSILTVARAIHKILVSDEAFDYHLSVNQRACQLAWTYVY